MNELQVFKNSEFGELGVLQIEGKVYFPATACAKKLGYVNPRKAIIDHCKSEGVTKRDGVSPTTNQHGHTTQQIVSTNYINEGNLYRLITNSKLPSAEKFESWVFDEVLPTIRKTGSYGNLDITEIITQTAISVSAEITKQLIPLFKELLSKNSNDTNATKKTAIYDDNATRCRRHTRSIISALDPTIRNEVEKMLVMPEKFTYSDIVNFLSECGVSVSITSVGRYAQTVNC